MKRVGNWLITFINLFQVYSFATLIKILELLKLSRLFFTFFGSNVELTALIKKGVLEQRFFTKILASNFTDVCKCSRPSSSLPLDQSIILNLHLIFWWQISAANCLQRKKSTMNFKARRSKYGSLGTSNFMFRKWFNMFRLFQYPPSFNFAGTYLQIQ